MFDVGFSELMIIALVALVVIGPERLPTVARTIGILLGRLQRYVNDVKSDINREMQLDELKKMQEQIAIQTREMQESLTKEMRTVEDSLNQSIASPDLQPVDLQTASSESAGPVGVTTPVGSLEPLTPAPEHQLELGLDSTAGKVKG